MQMWWSVPRQWPGETCFLIAGGPSVLEHNVEKLRGRKVIVINSSVHLVPWADILFFGDFRWWHAHRQLVDEFAGLAVSCATGVRGQRILSLARLKRAPGVPLGLSEDPSKVAMQQTSVTGAVNVAVHLGVTRIVCLGLDGRAAPDGRTHHHAPHRWPNRPGCWDKHRAELATIVVPLRARGVEFINASPGSVIDLWPIMSLDEALRRETDEPANQEPRVLEDV